MAQLKCKFAPINFAIMNKPKINPDIKNKLFSAKTSTVLDALQSLKEVGNKNYLPIMFELLVSNTEPDIVKEICKLLGTVKDQTTVPAFVEALQDAKFKTIQKEILIACWQNGLDYSTYLEVFVDIIINEEWALAFEAFTLIENQEYFPTQEELKETKLKIAHSLKSAEQQKAYFLEELLKMFP